MSARLRAYFSQHKNVKRIKLTYQTMGLAILSCPMDSSHVAVWQRNHDMVPATTRTTCTSYHGIVYKNKQGSLYVLLKFVHFSLVQINILYINITERKQKLMTCDGGLVLGRPLIQESLFNIQAVEFVINLYNLSIWTVNASAEERPNEHIWTKYKLYLFSNLVFKSHLNKTSLKSCEY